MLERYYPINQILESENFLVIQWLGLCFHCQGRGFNTWSGNQDPTSHLTWPKVKMPTGLHCVSVQNNEKGSGENMP